MSGRPARAARRSTIFGAELMRSPLARSRASTGRASATSGRASSAATRSRCATRSASTASCGAATSRTAKAAGRYCHEHLRLAFAGVDPDEVAAMVGGNAAAVYGFDLDALAPVAARVGPSVDEVADRSRRATSPTTRCAARRSPLARRMTGQAQARRSTMTRVRYGARSPRKSSRTGRSRPRRSVRGPRRLTAIYETDPEVVAAVLPPPLEPTDRPLVRVSVASRRSRPGHAAVRRRDLRGAGAPRGHRRQLPAPRCR